MNDPHFFPRRPRAEAGPPLPGPSAGAGPAPGPVVLPADVDDLPVAEDDPGAGLVEPRRATTRLKLAEGARGIKRAIRAESSFFAHAYRGLLIAITAAVLGVSGTGWCFLIVSAALVLLAETSRCALDAALEAVGVPPGDPAGRAAREIAAGGLLFASITSAGLTLMVLSSRMGEVFGW